MKHELSIRYQDLFTPVGAFNLRLKRSLTSDLAALSAKNSVVAGHGPGTPTDRLVLSGPLAVSDPEASFGAAISGDGHRRPLIRFFVLMLMMCALAAAVVLTYVYIRYPYMISGLFEHYLMYLPIPIDYE